MKKIIKKWYFIAGMICVFGFIIGYVGFDVFLDNVSAANVGEYDNEEELPGYENVFSHDLYSCSYVEEVGSIHILKKDNISRTVSAEYYDKNDIDEIIEQILGNEYEYVLTVETEDVLSYVEMQNGYPTGGRASFVLDDNDYIIEARIRPGELYNFDESTMISEEQAFNTVVQTINEKYGDDIIIDGNCSDYEIVYSYNGKIDDMCYEIINILGHSQEMEEMGVDKIYFTATISSDGSYVDIASTLGY